MERGQLFFDGNNETTRLQIKDLKTTDEGEYKCEITFLDITKDCPVVQLVKLTTLGKFCEERSREATFNFNEASYVLLPKN